MRLKDDCRESDGHFQSNPIASDSFFILRNGTIALIHDHVVSEKGKFLLNCPPIDESINEGLLVLPTFFDSSSEILWDRNGQLIESRIDSFNIALVYELVDVRKRNLTLWACYRHCKNQHSELMETEKEEVRRAAVWRVTTLLGSHKFL
jgi:hypothetical protein